MMKIQVTKIIETETFIVENEFYHEIFADFGDKVIEIPQRKNVNIGKNLPNNFYKINKFPPKIDYYLDEKENKITVEEYNEKIESIYSLYEDEIEQNYKLYVFNKSLKPHYTSEKDKIEYIPYNLLFRKIECGLPFCELYDSAFPDEESILLKFNKLSASVGIFREECQKYPFESVDIPEHSGIRFAKINGNYVFNDSFEFKNGKIMTYSQMQEEYEELKNIIQEKLLLCYNIQINKSLGGELLKSICETLQQIKNNAYKFKNQKDASNIISKVNFIDKQIINFLKNNR